MTVKPIFNRLLGRASQVLAALRGRERRLATLYVRENGSPTAVARRLRVTYSTAQCGLRRLFRRIRNKFNRPA